MTSSKLQFSNDNFYLVTVTKNSNGYKKIVKATKKMMVISPDTVSVCIGTTRVIVTDICHSDKIIFFRVIYCLY